MFSEILKEISLWEPSLRHRGTATYTGVDSNSREQLVSTLENYIGCCNNRRYQHRLFIQTPMLAHVRAMNRAA